MADKDMSRKVRKCERCNSRAAVFQRYNMYLCRRCFREMAPKMGFDKYE